MEKFYPGGRIDIALYFLAYRKIMVSQGGCGSPDDSAGWGPGMRRETHLGQTGATLW